MLLQIVYDYIMDAFEGQVVATTSRQGGGDVTIRDHTTIIEALKTRSYAMAKQAAKDTIQNWYSLMEWSDFRGSSLLQKTWKLGKSLNRSPLSNPVAPVSKEGIFHYPRVAEKNSASYWIGVFMFSFPWGR